MTDEQMRILCEWYTAQEAYGRTHGRWLHDHEQELARRVGVKDVEHVRVLEVDAMPAVPDELAALAYKHLNLHHANGLTVGHSIFIRKGHINAPLMKHELRHVEQVERYPDLLDFLRVYVEQVLAVGYENAPFEIDARNHEQV
jgi:hypothetical protein